MDILPPGFTLRNASIEDADAVAALILAVCTADGDPDDATTPAQVRALWGSGFDLSRDIILVTDPAGMVVGYEEFYSRPDHASYQGDGYVHPQYINQGVGTAMLQALEARARQEMTLAAPDRRVILRNFMTIGDQKGRSLHEHEGYRAVRFSWSMRIHFDSPPPAPQFPPGLELRQYVEAEHLYSVYEAIEESFRDHWGHVDTSFEDWKSLHLAPEYYHPDLWFVAWDGNQVAGVSICRQRSEDLGWVWSLGVRRPWRKQGLGRALLLHSFGEFYRRGKRVVGLGVDAANPTGATRLYESVGMSVETEYVCYEKELRPGREESV